MRLINLLACMLVMLIALAPLAFGLVLFAAVLYGP
jgi:hypothetical protein